MSGKTQCKADFCPPCTVFYLNINKTCIESRLAVILWLLCKR
ncbi:hypothetical protein HMPREF9193_01944 [Treponema lecithinolyticum ATCC 700332]|uniref:Uncharacterized protein n=1 Tax=Treponema lecithinolyticum ATCC 700332 TaxID=1321815 RepID=A0ABN0NWL6_TRELE|nr:hypothetical protein HMPREF9193_01944 [Treponema lecithinolyticum ATCC 700332]